MDIRKIRKLIELIDETGVAEIEIHEGEESVRICRSSKPQQTLVNYPDPLPMPTGQGEVSRIPVETPIEKTTTDSLDIDDNEYIVTAPMVGTVYFSPGPDADPFVMLGQEVSEGDTLCLIEAMKMFNEIETDADGTIKEIHVENAQPVEFGQPLFTIERH